MFKFCRKQYHAPDTMSQIEPEARKLSLPNGNITPAMRYG